MKIIQYYLNCFFDKSGKTRAGNNKNIKVLNYSSQIGYEGSRISDKFINQTRYGSNTKTIYPTYSKKQNLKCKYKITKRKI